MGLIALICRWVFRPTHTHVRRPPDPAHYGLLVSVTTAPSMADATMLRDVLVMQGVRASLSPSLDVLVFPADLDRARALLASR